MYGGTIEHDCCTLRSISYYLEPLLAVGPFCKMPLNLTLRGVTNDQTDPSIDVIRCSSIPILKRFLLVDDGLLLKISKRGAPPKGGGEVVFTCPIRKQLRPLQVCICMKLPLRINAKLNFTLVCRSRKNKKN